MKKPFSSGTRAFAIIVSILFSCLIWVYVNNDETVSVNVDGVRVEFLNAETTLANRGLVLVGGDDATVDLVLSMPRRTVLRFDPAKVRVIADLSSITTTGTQTISYSPVYPSNVNSSGITVRYPSVRTVSVRVGELYRKNVEDVRCKLVGSVASGYVAGSVQLMPATFEVWGQQSEVMQVSYAQVTLNIENATSTIVERLDYTLFDENDEEVSAQHIYSSIGTIQVTMPVIAATEIPLVVNYIEEPGVRQSSYDCSLDVTSVMLSGDAAQIDGLKEIVLGEVRLSEIDERQVISYEIEIPEGLSNLSGVTTATVTVENRDVTTKTVEVTAFDYDYTGNAADKTFSVVTSSLTVTLRGTRAVLDEITAGSVTAVANLSGIADASGTYTVPASFRITGNPDVGTVGDYQLTVRIAAQESTQAE